MPRPPRRGSSTSRALASARRDVALALVVSGAPTARLAALEAAGAAVADARHAAAELERKRLARHAARLTAHAAAKRQRDAAAERYARPTLTRAAAAGDVSAAAALAPLLRAHAGARSTLAARRAGALLRVVVEPLLGVQSAEQIVELCLWLQRQPELLLACRRAARELDVDANPALAPTSPLGIRFW